MSTRIAQLTADLRVETRNASAADQSKKSIADALKKAYEGGLKQGGNLTADSYIDMAEKEMRRVLKSKKRDMSRISHALAYFAFALGSLDKGVE